MIRHLSGLKPFRVYCRTQLLSWAPRTEWEQPARQCSPLLIEACISQKWAQSSKSVCSVCVSRKKHSLHEQTKQRSFINTFIYFYSWFIPSATLLGDFYELSTQFWTRPTSDMFNKWCFFCDLPRCACGQLTTQHVAIPPGANSVEEAHQLVHIDTPKDKWSVIKHTRTYPTDAFGLIEFQGGGFINKAMVRLIYIVFRSCNSTREVRECDLKHVELRAKWLSGLIGCKSQHCDTSPFFSLS